MAPSIGGTNQRSRATSVLTGANVGRPLLARAVSAAQRHSAEGLPYEFVILSCYFFCFTICTPMGLVLFAT